MWIAFAVIRMSSSVSNASKTNFDLLTRIRNDDNAAFEEFERANFKRLFAVAFAMLNNSAEAEDVVQEALLRFYQSRDDVQPETLTAYIYTITVNCARDSLRRTKRQRLGSVADGWSEDGGADFLDSVPSDAPDAEGVMLSIEQQQRLRTCLETLPAQQRVCIHLRYFEDLTQRSIAQILKSTDVKVYREMTRAVAHLRDCVKSGL